MVQSWTQTTLLRTDIQDFMASFRRYPCFQLRAISLFFWRFFQSMGGSLGPSLGAAVIGDILKLEERGGAMGVCFDASKLSLNHDLISIDSDSIVRSAFLDQFSLLSLQVLFSLP
jgi:hypothetical protein